MGMNGEEEETKFTAQEAAVYDRQLRLWGIEAQRRMQNSKVLVAGMTQLGSELVKNLVLSGINVTIQDSIATVQEHIESQFFLNESHLGENRAVACLPSVQELNPLVQVKCETQALADLPDAFFQEYNLICLVSASKEQQLRVNKICRASNIAFYSAHAFGLDAIMFADLQQHTYRKTPVGENPPPAEPLELNFPSLEQVQSVKWETLHSSRKRGPKVPRVFVLYQVLLEFQAKYGHFPTADSVTPLMEIATTLATHNGIDGDAFFSSQAITNLAKTATADVVPVCAILGGIIGQEFVKVISQKDEPLCNVFMFDGETGAGIMRKIAPSSA